MGITITTESLNNINACTGSFTYVTGSIFGISGSLQYISGSNNSAYFEKNIIYPFTCSNSKEVSWLMWAANKLKLTGSFYNSETNVSQIHYKPNSFENLDELNQFISSSFII